MKNCYLSHWSALVFWKAVFVQAYFGLNCDPQKRIDVTVFKPGHYYVRKHLHVHLCVAKVPREAKMEARGQMVVSPEFAFLQLAARLSILELILLGNLVCARPDGDPYQQVTTRKKLLAFVRKFRRQRGRQRAIRALRYISDDCQSIMEAFQHMMYSLPHLLGGCGLGAGEFGHAFELDEDGARALGQRRCIADVYWPRYRLVLEYDSCMHHSSAAAQARDAERLTVLARHGPRGGLHVVSVKTKQLYDPMAFQEQFRYIARLIGKRIRIRTAKYQMMHAKLREMLPRRGAISAEPSPAWA